MFNINTFLHHEPILFLLTVLFLKTQSQIKELAMVIRNKHLEFTVIHTLKHKINGLNIFWYNKIEKYIPAIVLGHLQSNTVTFLQNS